MARSKGQEVSLWAGVAAGLGSLLAIGLFDVFNVDQWAEYLGAVIVAAITGGAVYANQRLGFAKEQENDAAGTKPTTYQRAQRKK